jgi:hypothetical protein
MLPTFASWAYAADESAHANMVLAMNEGNVNVVFFMISLELI